MTRFYTVSLPNVSSSVELPCVDVLPRAGDILVVKRKFVTPGGQTYAIGDEIHLMERTWEAPFGALSELGNWRIISKYGAQIWAAIEREMFLETLGYPDDTK